MTNLVFEQKIDLPYRYTLGASQRAFLRGLAERRLLASSDGRYRYLPARPFAPDGCRLGETEEVEPRGVVVASTIAHHLGGRVFGLVRIDGSQTHIFHYLEEPLEPGTEVEPVWEDAVAEPSILCLRGFRRRG